jgi:hypothetical protein
MYVAWVVTFTTLWSNGLAAGVWNLQPLGQVFLLPAAVTPVFKLVRTTAFVLQTAIIQLTQHYSTLL